MSTIETIFVLVVVGGGLYAGWRYRNKSNESSGKGKRPGGPDPRQK